MRGYEIENELLHLKVSEWLCCTKLFTIKGKEASKYDFGEQEDFDDGYNNDGEGYDDEPGGCHCMTFTAKEPTKEVLDKGLRKGNPEAVQGVWEHPRVHRGC